MPSPDSSIPKHQSPFPSQEDQTTHHQSERYEHHRKIIYALIEELEHRLKASDLPIAPAAQFAYSALHYEWESTGERIPGETIQRDPVDRLLQAYSNMELQYGSGHVEFSRSFLKTIPLEYLIENLYPVIRHSGTIPFSERSRRESRQIHTAFQMYQWLKAPLGDVVDELQTEQSKLDFLSGYRQKPGGSTVTPRYDVESYDQRAMRRIFTKLEKLVDDGFLYPLTHPATYIREEGNYRAYKVQSPRIPFGPDCPASMSILDSILSHVEGGYIRGASIEVEGRLDSEWIGQITTADVTGHYQHPNLELIYKLRLPSGKSFSFIIKPAHDFTLKSRTDYSQYTDEDLAIIEKLENFFGRRDISNPEHNYSHALSIFSDLPPDNFPERLRKYTGEPLALDNLIDLFAFEEARVQSVWSQLDGLLLATDDIPFDYGHREEYADPDVFRGAVEGILHRLVQLDTVRSEIIPRTEQEIQDFLDEYTPYMYEIFNQERLAIRAEHGVNIRHERASNGYTGPEELYGLPLEHMIYDLVRTKAAQDSGIGRKISYEDSAEIYPIEQLTLEELERIKFRSLIATVRDPRGELQREYEGEERILRLHKEIVDINLKRIREGIPDKDEILKYLFVHFDADLEIFKERRKEIGLERAATLKKTVRTMRKAGNSEEDIDHALELVKELSETELYNLGEEALRIKTNFIRFVTDLFPQYTRENLAHIVHIEDSVSAKFIHIINRSGATIISPEIVDNYGLRRRRTHSELAQGRNIANAGELIFTRYQRSFTSWYRWRKFLTELQHEDSMKWQFSELNNATGHYQLPSTVLSYSQNVIVPIVEQLAIDTANLRIIDKLVPGLRLQGIGTYWLPQ